MKYKLMNKGFILSLAFVLALSACGSNAQQEEAVDNTDTMLLEQPNHEVSATDSLGPKIAFAEEKYDFGKIKQGEQVSHIFEFTNNGQQPLIISNVTAGCGCTTPKYDSKPINPGQKGKIEVGYNSAGQSVGRQQKMISVQSNAQNQHIVLQLNGEVTN